MGDQDNSGGNEGGSGMGKKIVKIIIIVIVALALAFLLFYGYKKLFPSEGSSEESAALKTFDTNLSSSSKDTNSSKKKKSDKKDNLKSEFLKQDFQDIPDVNVQA
ncbi:hypothetical protein TUBRATIS_17410 [Tubulinosema ratisbonensis]|uniref:Uncharacterized protein n=1 Tax=Tubulinosema ratisbonensis TaxID=291195 RepID=A0A437AKZ6_9MICR|nr:hypothetical protein TUBRATIS_17410 [Tubulinosema ratisbonensis]